MALLSEILADRSWAAQEAATPGAAVFTCAAQHFLDSLASLMVGCRVGTYQALLDCLPPGSGQVPMPGSDARLSPPDAAAVVAYQVNSSVYEDGSRKGACHPAAAVFPVLWALGQGLELPRLYQAMTAGYEAMVLMAALGNPSLVQKGFHPTGVTAPFGAAAAAGVLLGLDKDDFQQAFILAASGGCGLMRAFDEGSTQPLHVSHAVRAGVIAALMAQGGAKGNPAIFEAGFIPAYIGKAQYNEADFLPLADGKWALGEGYLKLYPGCRHVHPPVDAWARLVKEHDLDHKDVESIEVATYKVAVDTEIHHVKSRGDAYFNTPFALALMAVLGRADWEAFEPKHLQDPAVKDFAAKVRVYMDEEIESAYPQKRSAKVLVKLKNGQTLSVFQELAKGEPETPLSYAETAEKFRSEAGEYLEESDVSLIISTVEKAQGKAESIFSLLTGNFNKG